jgi:hypothetical protein
VWGILNGILAFGMDHNAWIWFVLMLQILLKQIKLASGFFPYALLMEMDA